jgi:hypothetical protein
MYLQCRIKFQFGRLDPELNNYSVTNSSRKTAYLEGSLNFVGRRK